MAGGNAEFDYTILNNISHFLGMDFAGMGNPGIVSPDSTVYEYENGNLYIKAGKNGSGDIQCINLLGAGEVSGVIRNWFMKEMKDTGREDEYKMKCILRRAGIPDSFINFMQGGKENDE